MSLATVIDRKFRTDALVGYTAQAGSVASNFLFMTMVTRSAGIATYGALVVLAALSSMLSNLLTFRTNEAVVAFCKQAEVRGELARARLALLAGACIDLAVGATLLVTVVWLADPIARHLIKQPGAAPEVALYAGVLFCTLLRGTPVGLLQSEGRFGATGVLTLGEHVGKVLVLLALTAGGAPVTLRGAVLAVLVPAGVAAAIGLGVLAVRLTGRFRGAGGVGRGPLREFLAFSASTFASSTLKAGNQQIDTLVLAGVSGPGVAGLYGLFRQFLSPLAFASGPLSAIAYPRFVQAVAERRGAAVRSTVAAINNRLAWGYGAMSVVIAVALGVYLDWMSIAVEPAQYAAFVLMVVTAYNGGRLWWARPFSNAVDPSLSLKANLGASVALLATLWPAASIFGINGVAAMMAAVSVALSVWWRRQLVRHA